jgi:hypothetical protein
MLFTAKRGGSPPQRAHIQWAMCRRNEPPLFTRSPPSITRFARVRMVAILLHDHVIPGNMRPHVTSHLALWSPATQITPSGQPAITPHASCVTASVPLLMIVMTTRDDFITAEMTKSGKIHPTIKIQEFVYPVIFSFQAQGPRRATRGFGCSPRKSRSSTSPH